MSRPTKAVVVLAGALAAAQFVRPSHANPPIDSTRAIGAHAGSVSALAAVLDRSCRDCHSNATVWPRAAEIAPLSWVMAAAVTRGRRALNFSEWASYSPEQQGILLALSCQDVSEGKMPGVYARVRPETRLSAADVQTICAAARQPQSRDRVKEGL